MQKQKRVLFSHYTHHHERPHRIAQNRRPFRLIGLHGWRIQQSTLVFAHIYIAIVFGAGSEHVNAYTRKGVSITNDSTSIAYRKVNGARI